MDLQSRDVNMVTRPGDFRGDVEIEVESRPLTLECSQTPVASRRASLHSIPASTGTAQVEHEQPQHQPPNEF